MFVFYSVRAQSSIASKGKLYVLLVGLILQYLFEFLTENNLILLTKTFGQVLSDKVTCIVQLQAIRI